MTSASREARASAAFVALSDTLVSDFDIVDLTHTLLESCIDLLDTDAGALLIVDAFGKLQLMASTSENVDQIEVIQLGADSGPCLACFSTGVPITVGDIRSEGGRWPEFRSTALKQGYGSMHATPLHLRGNIIGVMGLFHSEVGALNEQDIALAQSLSDVATMAILQDQRAHEALELTTQLQRALDSRIVVEQAKGLLAQSLHLDMDQAFAVLRDHARSTSQQLQVVATAVVNREIVLRSPDRTDARVSEARRRGRASKLD